MDILTRAGLEELVADRPGPCASFYLPTHRVVTQTGEDQLHLKNLLADARRDLVAGGARPAEAGELLAPAAELLDHPTFWRFQQDGLALFLAPGFARFYRLPVEFAALAVVAERFHLKPLLPALAFDERFYVLALSKNSIHLLSGNRYQVSEVELENVPKNLADALMYDEPERHLQFHQSAFAGRGRTTATFHGHGGGKDTAREDLLEYFRQIDSGILEVLRDERAPLVLAGVDYLLPIYRGISKYPAIAPEAIKGNPEQLSPSELGGRSWEIVEPIFRAESAGTADRVLELLGTGGASSDVREVVVAAHEGRVAALFVALGAACWGSYDPESRVVDIHDERQPGGEDLLNAAAVAAWLKGGSVYAVAPEAVPGGDDLAAIYRY